MISLDAKDGRGRGQILCSSKSCGRIKGQHCPFSVNFNKSAQLEMFQFTKADFNHSHPLNEPKMMVDVTSKTPKLHVLSSFLSAVCPPPCSKLALNASSLGGHLTSLF
jgi:hypothetical protein